MPESHSVVNVYWPWST